MEQRQLAESQPGCSYKTRNETCKLCGLNIPGGMEMSAHIEQHYEYAKFHDKDGHDKYHCDYCHGIFETDEIYGNHVIEEHRNEDDYPCPFCTIKFQKTDDLIDHVRVLHSDYKCPATSAWKCRDCSTVFENNAAWSNHAGRKLSRQEGLCQLCKKYYCNRQLLREHQDNVHNMKGQTYGKYFCQPCNKYFQNRKTFKVHNNLHDGGKYKCGTCDAKYNHPDQLARHKQIHHVRKSYDCKHCDIQFCVKGSWVRHMNTHAPPEEWKYICHVCDGAKFPTLDKLTRHMKKDENKHKVNCGLCQYQCLGRDTMKRHYNQIHGVNFYTP